jgi:hypothetical protein
MLNADKPWLWKADIAASVDLFNTWFLDFAPATYRQERVRATEEVKDAILKASDLLALTPDTLRQYPGILPILRMSTAPPLARDRLIGLAGVPDSVVDMMETGGLPSRSADPRLAEQLERIVGIIGQMIDDDIFPWVEQKRAPTEAERQRASTIVADRRCYAVTNPIIRNAHEQRQLTLIHNLLDARGYELRTYPSGIALTAMAPGTYSIRMGLRGGGARRVNIPVDVVVQPKQPRENRLPILIETKSAGDFANVNKRRKEEADKLRNLQAAHGADVQLILYLCGYFGSPYLGYEAAEGLDWVWEHRTDDLLQLGLD